MRKELVYVGNVAVIRINEDPHECLKSSGKILNSYSRSASCKRMLIFMPRRPRAADKLGSEVFANIRVHCAMLVFSNEDLC